MMQNINNTNIIQCFEHSIGESPVEATIVGVELSRVIVDF